MDLLNYIKFHFGNETVDLMINVMGLQPKSIKDIMLMLDLFIKSILILLIISIFYWVIRIVCHLCSIYNRKIREAKEKYIRDFQNIPETEHLINDNTEAAKEIPAVNIDEMELEEIEQRLRDVIEEAKKFKVGLDFSFRDGIQSWAPVEFLESNNIDFPPLGALEYNRFRTSNGFH